MSEPFEILDHTADIGFHAWGATLAELFENSAKALLSIAADAPAPGPRVERMLSIEGEDYPSLLVNWLNEILYLFDTNQFAASEFRVEQIEPTGLRARLHGHPRDPQREPWALIIKAVTYHELKIGQCNGRWESRVFLDV